MNDKPILELEESWVFGMLWPKRLRVFEDRLEVSGTELMRETIETVAFGEIEAIVIGGQGPSSSLLVRRRIGKPVLMRGVNKDAAHKAKTFAEERMFADPTDNPNSPLEGRENEILVQKLAELRDAGVLSPEEFEDKKRTLEKET